MFAIAFINDETYKRATEAVKNDPTKDLFETYKLMGGAFKEGTNEEIESTRKVAAIFDEEKPKKEKKEKPIKVKKLAGKKKRK